MSQYYSRSAALVPIVLLGLTSCGFFSDEHSDRSAAVAVQNYSRLTASEWLSLSQTLYQQGKYLESIGAARTALSLKPDYAEAYNNIGAAYAALRLWDPAIEADQQAVRLNPALQLARNNLAWALSQKNLEKR